MAALTVKAEYEGNLLELQGLNWHDDIRAQYSFSGLGLSTFGFVYALTDVWVDADTCQTLTWTPCDCDNVCG